MTDFAGPHGDPRIDLEDEPGAIVLKAIVPGIDPGELRAEVGDHTVWLHGTGRAGGREFSRTIPLPDEVKPGQCLVGLEGVFTVFMPKARPD